MKTLIILASISLYSFLGLNNITPETVTPPKEQCVVCHYKLVTGSGDNRSIDNVRSRWCEEDIENLKAYEAAFIRKASEKGAKAKCRWSKF